MFSLKEWNFEEYKAAVNEIQDPVERMDEINATYGIACHECDLSDNYFDFGQETEHQNKLINKRFRQLKSWALSEIKFIKHKYSIEIENIKKKAWKGHVRLPFPLVWDRKSYNQIEPEVRKSGRKKEWIDWLLKNLNEGNGQYWTFDQWFMNAVENEDYYDRFAQYSHELEFTSSLVGALEDKFIVFLFNVQKVLSLKDEEKRKRAIHREPTRVKGKELEKIILRTMGSRQSSGKSLHWLEVLRDLKNHTREGQRIVLSEIPAPDESMKEGISLYIDDYTSPIQTLLVSTFKKKLTQLRKLPLLE